MSSSSILVTGGAGYIGSHTVRQLGEAGEKVVTLDNLSKGFRENVLYGDFVEGDTADKELVSRLLRDHHIDTVIHFAAHTIVPESVAEPLMYYRNNTCATDSQPISRDRSIDVETCVKICGGVHRQRITRRIADRDIAGHRDIGRLAGNIQES